LFRPEKFFQHRRVMQKQYFSNFLLFRPFNLLSAKINK
jgi:hypothetical protein